LRTTIHLLFTYLDIKYQYSSLKYQCQYRYLDIEYQYKYQYSSFQYLKSISCFYLKPQKLKSTVHCC